MPPGHQVVDSLWHCLCPSFPGLLRRFPKRATGFQASSRSWLLSSRRIGLRSVGTASENASGLESEGAGKSAANSRLPRWGMNTADFDDDNRLELLVARHRDDTAEQLWDAVEEAARKGDMLWTYKAVEMLVAQRKERPNVRHYTAMLAANTNTDYGSVAEIECLLGEMETNAIPHDAASYEATLKALAIHPSYTLRSSLLEEMKKEWIEVTSRGWHYITCGLLRDRQIELALETLVMMQRANNVKPANWLIDVFIHTLAEVEEFDAMLELLRERNENLTGRPGANRPSRMLWMHCLSKAAQAFHHPSVMFIWNQQVQMGYMNPPTGLCSAILDTASRAGDEILATDVLRVLGNRSSDFSLHEYEALVEAHVRAQSPDLTKILSMICIMGRSSKGCLTDATLRPLFLYLRSDKELPRKSLEIIQGLRENLAIPVPLLNAIMDASQAFGDLDWALEVYKQMHLFSPTGLESRATTFTFNALLRGCWRTQRKEVAMFLAAEMVALGVPPNQLTYDRLILSCLAGSKSSDKTQEVQKQNLDDAFNYLGEMTKKGYVARNSTLETLGKAAVRIRDGRLWALIEQMEDLGFRTQGIDKTLAEEEMSAKQVGQVLLQQRPPKTDGGTLP